MKAIEKKTIEKDGRTLQIKVCIDPCPDSPFGNMEMLGTMAGNRSSRNCPEPAKETFSSGLSFLEYYTDEDYEESPEQFIESAKESVLWIDVDINPQSYAVSTSRFPDPDDFQEAVYYVEKADVIKEYGDFSPESQEKALARMESEMEIYSSYCQGEVYGFKVIEKTVCPNCGKKTKNEIDSCWGFYSIKDALEAAEQSQE